jgi:hypothetical protein
MKFKNKKEKINKEIILKEGKTINRFFCNEFK